LQRGEISIFTLLGIGFLIGLERQRNRTAKVDLRVAPGFCLLYAAALV
jgi:hypothetical protein